MSRLDDFTQIKELKEVLYNIIVSNLHQNEDNFTNSYSPQSIEVLERKKLIKRVSNTNINKERFEVVPWLNARIFEEVVAKEGLDRYLEDLLSCNDENLFNNVKLNSYLATSHIAFSTNKFILQLLDKINTNQKYLTDSEAKTVEKILVPIDKYAVENSEIRFDFNLVENIKLKIEEYIFNNIDIQGNEINKDKTTLNTFYSKIPDDIKIVLPMKFNYSNLIEASSLLIAEGNVKVIFLSGGAVWIKREGPIIYITKGGLGYSPSVNKKMKISEKKSIDEVKLIDEYVMGNKNLQEKIYVPCSVCGKKAELLVYHSSQGLTLVCEKCSKKPQIKAFIDAKLISK